MHTKCLNSSCQVVFVPRLLQFQSQKLSSPNHIWVSAIVFSNLFSTTVSPAHESYQHLRSTPYVLWNELIKKWLIIKKKPRTKQKQQPHLRFCNFLCNLTRTKQNFLNLKYDYFHARGRLKQLRKTLGVFYFFGKKSWHM